MHVTPRPAQALAIPAALKGLRSRAKRALVVLATGLGKTLVGAITAKKFRSRRTLFLAHSTAILDNAMENEFPLVFDEKTRMALYTGLSKRGAEAADIVFATWQTMGRNLKKWARNHFDLIIVDEAHHTEAETYRPVVDYFTGAYLALTATPNREDEADIRDVFGSEVIHITLEEAIARGWLPRIEYHVITDEGLDEGKLQEIVAEIREGKKRFTMAEVNRRLFIHKRDEEIAKIIDGYPEKTIVFCASIQHAERMKKTLSLSAVFHSAAGNHAKETSEKNKHTLNALSNGIIRRVCAVDAFNEGVNVPSVGLVAFCRVTGSDTVFRQQLGRGLRPGKEKLIVLDFVGNLERIQMVRSVMQSVADLHEEYTSRKEREQEGYIRRAFEVSGKGFEFTFSDQVVDLMEVLQHVHSPLFSYKDAHEKVRELGLTQVREYKKYVGQPTHDQRLPASPDITYQGSGWTSWNAFFGKEPLYKYKEASKRVRELRIENEKRYQDYLKKPDRDPRLPTAPRIKYQDTWAGWPAFLGRPDQRGGRRGASKPK